jgi:c(7)-type cytochrome triheme protein
MNRHVSLTLALAAALAAGCSAKGKKAETEKEGARPPVTFTHKIHVDQGLECTQCHPNIAKSNSLADANLPTTAVCKDCHDDKKAPPESKEPPRLTFSHAWHLPIVKNKCDTCHKQLPEPGELRAVPRDRFLLVLPHAPGAHDPGEPGEPAEPAPVGLDREGPARARGAEQRARVRGVPRQRRGRDLRHVPPPRRRRRQPAPAELPQQAQRRRPAQGRLPGLPRLGPRLEPSPRPGATARRAVSLSGVASYARPLTPDPE